MNEGSPQENQEYPQEKNIGLGRPDMVKEYNELNDKWNELDGFDRDLALQERGSPENIEIYKRKNELYSNVTDIDRYRKLAKPAEGESKHIITDTSTLEKIKQEKEKVTKEINNIQGEIEQDGRQLNYLRGKLGMSPSEDIPSLANKRKRLGDLLVIQSDLEGQLKFVSQKTETEQQEKSERKNIESSNINENLENISSSLKSLSSLLEERQHNGYHTIFSDEEGFRVVARKISDSSDIEDIKTNLTRMGAIVEDFADHRRDGINDNAESLYRLSSKLGQLSASLLELPSKLQSEEQRKEFAQTSQSVEEKISVAAGRISNKARALEEYENLR